MADNTITKEQPRKPTHFSRGGMPKYDGSSLLLNGENLGIWTTHPQYIAYGESNVNYAEKSQVDELDARAMGLISSNDVQINSLEDEIKSLKKIISNLSTQLYTHLGQHQKQEAET